MLNTADYLLENGGDEQLALIAAGQRWRYCDLRRAAARLAGELQAAGVGPGQPVGILGRNSPFWAAAYLAVLKLGAIAVLLSPAATPADLAAQRRLAGCRIILAERQLALRASECGRAEARADGLPVITEDVLSQPGLSDWSNGKADLVDSSPAALMFTSGTTSAPRAVVVSHRNIQANTEAILAYLGLHSSDRMLAVLPFYYCFGTSLLHTHLRAGASLVLANSTVFLEATLGLLAAEQCTGLAGVPSLFQALLRNSSFSRRAWPSLRQIQQAGGKLSDVLIRELQAAAPGAEVFIMYGATEATARLSYLPPECLSTKLGSIGKGLHGVSLRVVDASGQTVRPGEVGEIVARGDNVCLGYWNDPLASAQKFVNGELHTGDLATVDDEGFIYIVDREADFIKSYGHRVSSQQVEACILEMPQVVSAAVVGEPDPARGEAIRAFVVGRSGEGLAAEQVQAHCARRLARHMVPASVTLLDRLPMNDQGKVIKRALRGLPAAAEARVV
jgi:long-chain acyl-CoA synthetase